MALEQLYYNLQPAAHYPGKQIIFKLAICQQYHLRRHGKGRHPSSSGSGRRHGGPLEGTYMDMAYQPRIHFKLTYYFQDCIGMLSTRDQKLWGNIRIAWFQKRKEPGMARHYLFVRIIYLFFYILIALMSGTGIWMAFHKQPRYIEAFHSVKEIHENCFLVLLLFIAIHLAGVIRFERKHRSNLISAMVHGGSKQ